MTKTTDFVRSLTRLGWSLSVLGAEQASQAFTNLGSDTEGRAARVFDRVSEAAEAGMSTSAREVFRGVDRFQARLIDFLFGASDPLADPLTEAGRNVARAALITGGASLTRRSLETLMPSLDGRLRLRATELVNELESFELFADPRGRLGIEADCCSDHLPACLRKARQQDTWRAAWLIEGIGYLRAERAWIATSHGETSNGASDTRADGKGTTDEGSSAAGTEVILDEALLPLVNDSAPEGPEPEDRIPMHTGMGLSLARRYLPRLRRSEHRPDALAELHRLARRNALPGFDGVVLEPLGFVVRMMSPELASAIDRALVDAPAGSELADAGLRASFWHGVGRGIYFAPSHFEPGAWRRAFEEAIEIAPDALARQNLLSGHAWAVTLVNLRQPEILEAFLAKAVLELDPGSPPNGNLEAVGLGIETALLVWAILDLGRTRDAAPEPRLETLLRHQPGFPNGPERDAWLRFVVHGAERAPERARLLAEPGVDGRAWSELFRVGNDLAGQHTSPPSADTGTRADQEAAP